MPPPEPSAPAGRTRLDHGRLIGLAQIIRLLIRVGSAAVLSRLLTPESYGLHGMAAAVFGFLHMARDLGIVAALQQPEITRATFNAHCRIGALGGIALALIGVGLAVPTGWFFHEAPRVPVILMVMSASFVFSGLAAPAMGVLFREQRTQVRLAVELGAIAFATAAAVLAAWAGWGVWALVLLSVSTEAALCAFAWWACPWKPGRDTVGVEWRQLAEFGVQWTGHHLATYVRQVVDQIAVGRTAGVEALGVYGRGAQVAALPVQVAIAPFAPWALAALSRLGEKPPEFVRVFRYLLNNLLHVSLATAVLCVAVPEIIVAVLFGPTWTGAVPVVRWLGVALAFQPWLQAPAWVLGVSGQSHRLLLWSLSGAGLVTLACLGAAAWGPDGIAAAAALATAIHAATALRVCRSTFGLRVRDWLQPAANPLWLHGGFGLVSGISRHLVADRLGLLAQVSALFALMAVYYGAALLTHSGVRTELRHHLYWNK